jgi:DNA-binding GntR family transcriptional regulator
MRRPWEREASDPLRISEAWASAHADFHRALVAGCGSLWLLKLRAMLYAQSERYRRLSVPVAKHDRDLEAEHRGIMEAALARDANRAVQLLTEHLSATTRILLDAPEVKSGISGATGSRAPKPARRGVDEELYRLSQDA